MIFGIQNDYYPYGMLFGTSVGEKSKQPYKFGGKEYIPAKGFNMYDFGARGVDGADPQWKTMDPLCERYYSVSPYAYCANNPVNAIDPTGELIIFINGMHSGSGGKADY